MTSVHGDPYRILGLLPGATETQVKSAYRRLVKKYHPDAAGEATIGRFLAVQAAYDALMDPASGHLRARPRTAARRAPWNADDDRVRATQRAYGRTGTTAGTGGSERRASPGSGWDWARSGAGAGEAGPRSGSTGPDPGRPSEQDDARDRGTAAGQASRGQPGAGRERGDRPTGGRRRQRDHHVPKARPGSTTYDGADRDPEPEWDGATWYGPTMGTYWTINPKEYADPRKHGPEYQARAWRAVAGGRGRRGAAAAPAPASAAAPASPPAPEDRGAASPPARARGGLLGRILRGRTGQPRGDAE